MALVLDYKKECSKIWNTASTFSELQRGMIMFLEGKCKSQPWHLDPVAKETIPLLETLIEINKLGYVTTEGQPGTITEEKIAKTSTFGKKGDTYKQVQRGYMWGFIQLERGKKLKGKLKENEKVCYFSCDKLKQDIHGVSPDMYVPNEKGVISLTEEVGASMKDYATVFDIRDKERFLEEASQVKKNNKALYNTIVDETMLLCIFMKKQGDTSLDKIVLECLEKIK